MKANPFTNAANQYTVAKNRMVASVLNFPSFSESNNSFSMISLARSSLWPQEKEADRGGEDAK